MLAQVSIEHNAICLYMRANPGWRLLSRVRPALHVGSGPRLLVKLGLGSHAFEHENIINSEYRWVARSPLIHSILEGTPRCSGQRVHLHFNDYGLAAVTLPPPHMMTWPHLRECERYDMVKELMRECMLRRKSALAHREYPPPPPPHVQLLLTEKMRLELFDGNLAAGAPQSGHTGGH